jgi:hypothetical protein
MRLPWTARTRRVIFVVAMLLVLTFPLVASLITRARLERSGVDVTATVVETSRKGDDGYLVAFRLPEEIDHDQHDYAAKVDRAAYEKAVASKEIRVRVLEDRPAAHRVEGQIDSKAPYVFMIVADVIVLGVGILWIRKGRRRPSVRMLARADLEPAGPDDATMIGRTDGDVYEAVGTVTSADGGEVVLDLGERSVVVALAGYACPVEVGATARARGPLVG